METSEILALYDKEMRIDVEFPDMRKEILPHVVRFVRPAPGKSFVLYSRLNAAEADAVINAQLDYFATRQLPLTWKVYDHDTPPDLLQRLAARGGEIAEPEAIMVLDLHEAPVALLAPVKNPIRRITRREELRDVIRVMEAVWGGNFDWMIERMGRHLEIPGYLSVYLAEVDGEPACAGWTYFYPDSQFAGLWGGSTVARFRKRGLYTTVLATRVQEAIRRQRRFLTIDASPMSQPIVTRHGFRLLGYAHDCEWEFAAEEYTQDGWE